MKPDVLVVGAGAAGILAAWRAASLGAKVLLLEKTPRIGTKILVSGGGKCNITQSGEVEDVLKAFLPNEARFLRPAFYRFFNEDIVRLLTDRGLRVYTRPDGRIFPVEQTAKDVVAILGRLLDEAGVEVRRESPVTSLIVESGGVAGVRLGKTIVKESSEGEGGYRARTAKNLLRRYERVETSLQDTLEVRCSRVVLSVGGSSYPNSGTTGDGWPWAREAGHRVERLRAALAPLYLEQPLEASGIGLKNVVLKARQGKEAARWRGDLLFTHQGLSGPCALGISRIVAERMEQGKVEVEVDLRPDQTPEEVAAELQAFVAGHPSRKPAGFLKDLPERLAEAILEACGVPPDQTNAHLDRKARNRLSEAMKGWRLGRVRHVPLEKGEVVAGGVSLDEVDPKSMASRIVPGLLLCGEVLNIAGPVGGYNLQAAFSTGFVAGESAAKGLSD